MTSKITAHALLKNVALSPKKGNMFIYRMRTLPVKDMLLQLLHSQKKAASLVLKCLRQCMAHWKKKFRDTGRDWKETNPLVHVEINRGRKLSRWEPRARGRSYRKCKHYCHIKVSMHDPAQEEVSA